MVEFFDVFVRPVIFSEDLAKGLSNLHGIAKIHQCFTNQQIGTLTPP
jgi:hypothetical protein